MFAFLGVEIVTIAASESPNPAQQISRATRSVVWRVCLFYIGSIFLIAALVPWNDPLLGQPGYGAYRRTLELLGVPGAQFLMNFVVLTSVSSCLVSAHYTASRMLYSLARRGDAPAMLQHARQRHTGAFGHRLLRRGGVHGPDQFRRFPASQDVLDTLMNITGMVAMLVYLVIACSQLRMRGKLRAEGKEPLVRMWLFPWLTWAVIIFIVAALITMVFVDEYRTVVLSTGAAALAVVAIGLLRHGRRGRAPAGRGPEPPGRRSPGLSVCNRGRVGPWSRYFPDGTTHTRVCSIDHTLGHF